MKKGNTEKYTVFPLISALPPLPANFDPALVEFSLLCFLNLSQGPLCHILSSSFELHIVEVYHHFGELGTGFQP